MQLYNLAKGYDTDRNTSHIEYLYTYDSLLSMYREKDIKFIEIGTYLGESVRMWREYFSEASVFSVEHPNCSNRVENNFDLTKTENPYRFKSNDLKNTEFCFIDSRSVENVNKSFDDYFFDVIIDDGDHAPHSQIGTLLGFYSKLKKGGLYFIEDIKGPMNNREKNKFFNIMVIFMDCFAESEIRMFSGTNNILGIIKKPVSHDMIGVEIGKLSKFLNCISRYEWNASEPSDIEELRSIIYDNK